jgi:phage terminase small subunit
MTPKRELFCLEYMIDHNAAAASVRAGYSKKGSNTTGSQLLAIPCIAERLAGLEAEKIARLKAEATVTEDDIMRELKSLGFANIEDYVAYDDDGVSLISSKELTRSKLAAVKSVKMKQTRYGTEVEFDLYEKGAALVKMGEQIGMFKSKMEITGKDGKALFEKMEDAALDDKINKLLAIVSKPPQNA